MRLSTKGRYGTRLIVDIAANQDSGPVLLKDIAKRQGISEKYLGNIVTLLRNAGLLRSKRGSRGGYLLAREAGDINLYDILSSLEGSICLVDCVEAPEKCSSSGDCASRQLWTSMSKGIKDMMCSVSLQSLAEKQKSTAAGLVYSI